MSSNACDTFLAKWAEFNENTDMDPTDIVWSEFWRSPTYGLARVGKFGPATTAQQLASNINRFFAEDQYGEELTAEETDFIWNLYQRVNAPVPDDLYITCNLLNHIVNTPTDQLNSIDWSIFDGEGSVSNSDDESGDYAPVATATFPPSTFPAPNTFGGVPPSQQVLQPFPNAQSSLTAPASNFNPRAFNPLMPGLGVTTPMQPQVPGGLLQGGPAQAVNFGGFLQPTATAATSNQPSHDLPYVTTVVKGLKTSDKSRLLMINIDDDGAGNKIQIGIFITAGEVPATVINTTFGTDDYSFKDKDQKSQIHEQNKKTIAAHEGLMPSNLSNGVDEKGVCAQLIRGFSAVSAGTRDQDCKPDSNRPRSVKRDGAAAGPSAFGIATGFPTQPGLGQIPMGQTQFPAQPTSGGFGSQPTSGGFGTPPTSGGFAGGAILEVAPPGTRTIQVPDFDKPGTFREAYQIPGGPHPIAVGKKVGKNPGTWYWFQLPSGVVVKSEQRYLGLLDDKSMTKKHGDLQLIRVNEILRMMQGQYGPTFNQVAGAPTGTGAMSGPKSGGRGKAATSGGGLPAGFQPAGTTFQMGAVAVAPAGGFGQVAAPQPMGSVFPAQATAPQAAFGQPAPPAGFQPSTVPAGFGPATTPAVPAVGTMPTLLQNQLAPPPAPTAQGLFGGQAVAQATPAPTIPSQQPAAQQLFAFGAPAQPAVAQVVAPQATADLTRLFQAPPAQFPAAQAPQPAAAAPQQNPATNPLLKAMLQSQQQTAPIPSGLFGQQSGGSLSKP